jgi:glucose 1-dehydrogenase
MRAMTVVPGQKGTAGIEEVPDPGMQDGALLVRGTAAGICGTDREIAEGAYGTPPPPGEARLVIGHESLGQVLKAPTGSGFAPGDPVVGIDPGWLGGLITRRVPLTSWTEALNRRPEDIKVVVDLTA